MIISIYKDLFETGRAQSRDRGARRPDRGAARQMEEGSGENQEAACGIGIHLPVMSIAPRAGQPKATIREPS